jgi:hypothetical protein
MFLQDLSFVLSLYCLLHAWLFFSLAVSSTRLSPVAAALRQTLLCASIKYFYSDETIFEIYIEKEVAKGQCLVFI